MLMMICDDCDVSDDDNDDGRNIPTVKRSAVAVSRYQNGAASSTPAAGPAPGAASDARVRPSTAAVVDRRGADGGDISLLTLHHPIRRRHLVRRRRRRRRHSGPERSSSRSQGQSLL